MPLSLIISLEGKGIFFINESKLFLKLFSFFNWLTGWPQYSQLTFKVALFHWIGAPHLEHLIEYFPLSFLGLIQFI